MSDRMSAASPRGTSPRFAALGWRDRIRFLSRGRWLLQSELHRLATLPTHATRVDVARAQRMAAHRVLQHLQVDLCVTGHEQLPTTPGLIVSLHEGMADALCLASLPWPMRFVARREVFEWPGIGAAMRRCGHIAIDPEQGARAYRQLVRDVGAALSSGDHVVIFPQGTLLGIQTAFLPGAFSLAQRLGAPIVPIVLAGSHRIWEHPFSSRVRYGQPVAMRVLAHIPAKEVQATDPVCMRLRLQREMKRIALAEGGPRPRHYLPDRDGTWPGFRFEIDADWRQA